MRKIIFWMVLALLALPIGARAQTMEIAAVVNDEVISRLDIDQRLALISLSANIALSPENRPKIIPQILRNLIDERIQLQEAKRLNIVASEGEITAAVARLAAQNNIPPDQFESYITEKGGSFDSLLEQIKATLAWTKVVRQKFATSAIVTDDEINQQAERIQSNLMAPQYLLAEIGLAVENPADEEEVKQLADRLVQEILGGAGFAPLARQFSQTASAPSGGDLGWIKRGQLPPALDQKLSLMMPNQVTKPIRTNDGYVILFLRDLRTPEAGSSPPIDRQAIADGLRQKKLESASKKYLRDLRSLALIDLRS